MPRKLPNLFETDNKTFYPWSCYVMFGYNFSGIKYFGPPLVQFGARDCRINNFFPGPYDPFSFVRDEELEGRCYLNFFDSLYGCRNTLAGIEASAKTASGNQPRWWKDRFLRNNSLEVFFVSFNSDMGFVVDFCGNQWWWSNDVTLMWPHWRKHTDATKFSFQPRGTVTHHNRRSRQKMTFMTGQINSCTVCVSHLIRSWIYDTWISWNGGFYTLHN